MPYCKDLLHLTSTFEAAESSSHQNVISLLDVSLGRLNDLEVKDHLDIDSDEDLFILMAHSLYRCQDSHQIRIKTWRNP